MGKGGTMPKQAETITVVGEITKVETFTTSGGGIQLKVRIPHDGTDAAGRFFENVQRVADIEFDFRATYADEDESEEGDLFEEDE
jgi:hypothetical protein